MQKTEMKNYWNWYSNLTRNNKAQLLGLLGLACWIISIAANMYLPSPEPINHSGTNALIYKTAQYLFIFGLIAMLVGALFINVFTTCPHCKRKV